MKKTDYILSEQNTLSSLFNQIYKKFASPNNYKQSEFLKFILTEKLWQVLGCNTCSQPTISRIMSSDSAVHQRHINLKHYLLKKSLTPDGSACSYYEFTPMQTISGQWSNLLSNLDIEQKQQLHDFLQDIINHICDCEICIRERLSSLLSENFSDTLACLTLLAATFTCWKIPIDQSIEDLSRLLLPPLQNNKLRINLEQGILLYNQARFREAFKIFRSLCDVSDLSCRREACYYLYLCGNKINDSQARKYLNKSADEHYHPAIQLRQTLHAKDLLTKARRFYLKNDNDSIQLCCEYCRDILQNFSTADNVLCGEAAYMLYRCSDTGQYKLPTGESSLDYLEKSNFYGYQPSAEEWAKRNHTNLLPTYAQSMDQTSGVCYFNANNIQMRTFANSIPVNWQTLSLDEHLTSINNKPCHIQNLKYLLFNDDTQRNLQDFLQILEQYRKYGSSGISLQIFIRGHEEYLRPLVDTALSHITFDSITVQIIDDARWVARQLLISHPLFFPIRTLPQLSLDVSITLQFVILGTDEVAMWLVREACWLMSFRGNIRSNIVVIGPDANQFKDKFYTLCPAMKKHASKIDGIPLAKFDAFSFDFNSPACSQQLTSLFQKADTYSYFAVTYGTDEENFILSMRLRELLVRDVIETRRSDLLWELPPIAFYCRDDNLSKLSSILVADMEKFGNQWFNTWALISFGNWATRYRWDALDGGIFTKIAQGIHLNYCKVDPSASSSKKQDAMRQYWRHQYNQDSSISTAISLAYRLFQFQYAQKIIPLHWNILNPNVYTSENSLHGLADMLEKMESITSNSEQQKELAQMAEWEHGRWVRLMISRGWIGASIDTLSNYMNYGSPRHQLYLARIHPCLCSNEELNDLADWLKENQKTQRNFHSNDLKVIKTTKEQLTLAWIDKSN